MTLDDRLSFDAVARQEHRVLCRRGEMSLSHGQIAPSCTPLWKERQRHADRWLPTSKLPSSLTSINSSFICVLTAGSTMIRLPPSTIVLGRSDIKDYEKRRRTQKRVQHRESVTEQISERIARFAVRSSQDSTVPDLVIQTTVRTRFAQHGRELPKLTSLPHEPPLEKLSFTQSQNATFPSQGDSPSSPPQPADSYDELALTDFSSDEETSITALELAPENPASDSQQPVSPAKYEFYYGGFIESPSQYEENDTLNYDTLNRSSPFGTQPALSL